MNLDLLKEGSVNSIASVVQALYHRSKIKELPVQERKLFDSALKILTAEISFSLDKPKEEIEQMIFDRLEKE
jgi:CarD family transcriptional regulator